MGPELFLLALPFLLGLIIPSITELVTKAHAPDKLKSAVVIALALLAAVIPTVPVAIMTGGLAATLGTYLTAVFIAWVTSGRAYLAGMANKAITVNPNSGLGPELPQVDLENPTH